MEVVRGGRRLLMSFKETPTGGNVTFDCSPSGPCVACLYSEKKDEKYRCSETGYRIPLKCEETGAGSNEANSKTAQKGRSILENSSAEGKLHMILRNAKVLTSSTKHRSLLADLSTSASGSEAYITYRSCIPAVNEEKLSVLGFEGIMLGMLLISSSVIYIKRKRSGAPPGAVRIPTSSRF